MAAFAVAVVGFLHLLFTSCDATLRLTAFATGPSETMQSSEPEHAAARVAFVGNSILYYNDTPRFMVNLGRGGSGGRVAFQDSCFRGGTNLAQLWQQGNAMARHGFATEAARIEGSDGHDVGAPTVRELLARSEGGEAWDFVVMNDHTQGPARPEVRDATREALETRYLPLVAANGATPIVVETAAYGVPGTNGSEDLGSTREFQRRVREGVLSYVEAMGAGTPPSVRPRMAPVGTAYLRVHDDDPAMWEKLFDPFDHFHPSPHGTFLQGCVLHRVMFGSPPPLPKTEGEIADLWKDSRMMHNVRTGGNRPLPTVEEAACLWDVANEICS